MLHISRYLIDKSPILALSPQEVMSATIFLVFYDNTVTLVWNGHSIIDKTKILITIGSFMKVESIAECSFWSILQCLWPALSDNWSWKSIFCLFESGRFTEVLLYHTRKRANGAILCWTKYTVKQSHEQPQTWSYPSDRHTQGGHKLSHVWPRNAHLVDT